MIAPFFDIDLLPLLVVMAAFLIFPLQLFLCRSFKGGLFRICGGLIFTDSNSRCHGAGQQRLLRDRPVPLRPRGEEGGRRGQ